MDQYQSVALGLGTPALEDTVVILGLASQADGGKFGEEILWNLQPLASALVL